MRKPVAHIVADRMVFTYQPQGRPVGVLTGYLKPVAGGHAFMLEHVIAFPEAPRWMLVHMLNAALQEAWTREYRYVAFHVAPDHAQRAGLVALGRRCGFTEYARTWWVRHQPQEIRRRHAG